MANRTINSLPSLGLNVNDEFEIQQAGDGPSGKVTLAEILQFVPDEATWGNISGNINNQLDLIARLNAKTDLTTFNAHVANNNVHYAQSDINHNVIQNRGVNTHAQIDTHLANTNIHFTQEQIDHTRILNRGVNTHTQIDSHIANVNIHFADAPANGNYYARRDNAWATDPIFDGAGSAASTGWVPDPGPIGRGYFLEDSGTWEAPPIQPVATPTAKYINAGVSGPVNPGSGNIKTNFADAASITEAYVSSVSRFGNSVAFIWRSIQRGDVLAVFASGGGSNVNYWRVTANTIDNGSWFIVPVENIEFTGPLNGTEIEVFFLQRQVVDGDTDGQMLVWDESIDRLWGPTSAIKVDLETSDVLVANNLFVGGDVVAGGGARETYTGVAQLQAVRDGGAATGLLIHTRSDQIGYITFGDGEVAGRIQYNHTNDVMSFNTNGSEAMRIASAGGVMIGTAATNGALLRLKQQGGALTNGLQIASSGSDDYLGYLVAQFAGDKFTVGAGGAGGDPAQGGKLVFDDFGWGWSLYVGDGAGGQLRTLFGSRDGYVNVPRGNLRGGQDNNNVFNLRSSGQDQYVAIYGGADSTGGAFVVNGPVRGIAEGIYFNWASEQVLGYIISGRYWHFRDQTIDYAPVLRARTAAAASEFTQIIASALQFNRNVSYIDQIFDGGFIQFRMSSGGDRNVNAGAIQADGNWDLQANNMVNLQELAVGQTDVINSTADWGNVTINDTNGGLLYIGTDPASGQNRALQLTYTNSSKLAVVGTVPTDSQLRVSSGGLLRLIAANGNLSLENPSGVSRLTWETAGQWNFNSQPVANVGAYNGVGDMFVTKTAASIFLREDAGSTTTQVRGRAQATIAELTVQRFGGNASYAQIVALGNAAYLQMANQTPNTMLMQWTSGSNLEFSTNGTIRTRMSFAGEWNHFGQKIIGVGDGTASTDVATVGQLGGILGAGLKLICSGRGTGAGVSLNPIGCTVTLQGTGLWAVTFASQGSVNNIIPICMVGDSTISQQKIYVSYNVESPTKVTFLTFDDGRQRTTAAIAFAIFSRA